METQPRRALVVVDAQLEYFDEDRPLAVQYPPRDESRANLVEAIDVAIRNDVPVVTVRHELPQDAPVFAAGSEAAAVHPAVLERATGKGTEIVKRFSSVFADTGLTEWLRAHQIDTITLVGYMTNNCVLATAASAEPLGFTVEVLRDATGAVHLSNEAGSVSARQVHDTLMVLLHSNFAAVATTGDWTSAVSGARTLPKNDLGNSAIQGRSAHSGR
ncbi:isochorismatase family protein [Amycolatopsis magusensis]|uniref:isochorismatase family protein n=1 Tax=Amycolatopsis magusensis TaxID=882444 RepID=UPI0024A7B375|nr:isochorismatase family protein [Amycolatopsis magusensis]MDI5976117.1 isochorismatase family protein [Amycolatopsis magusensis]